MNAKITVERVSIRLVKSVVLGGVYVEDQHGDTMIYLKELNVSISDISTSKHYLKIGKLTLSDGVFNLVRYKGESHDNLKFLTDYFASTDTAKGTPWDLKVADVQLQNMRFRRENENETPDSYGVDFEHLNVSAINGEFKNFHTQNDSIFADIRNLRFKDRSGFEVQEFTGDAKVSNTEIRVNHFVLRTPYTHLKTDVAFQYDSFPDFDEFTHNVRWNSDFDNSQVSFKDIAFFAPDLKGVEKAVSIDGFFKGSVNRFKGKNVKLEWGNRSSFKGSIAITGLPDIEDTYFDIDAKEIVTSKHDVELIPANPIDSGGHVIVPENFDCLGNVSFTGRFNGFFSDFVAYGTLNTAIGLVSSDINMKYDSKKKSTFYSGHLSCSQFDVGRIAKISDLGRVTLSADVKGNGLRLDNINATLSGKVEALAYKGYEYHNLEVDGQIARKLFNGALSISDPSLDMDFKGTIDFRKTLPEFNFLSDIRHARLDTVNLYAAEGEPELQTRISTQFKGNKPDNLVGNIHIENTNFKSGKRLYHITSIDLNSEIESGYRTIDVNSDNVDAHFQGSFEFATLIDAFKEILPQYLPSVILPKKSFISKQNFTYDIRLKNLNVVTENFLPSWDFAPNTELKGYFNSMAKDFKLNLTTPYIRYKKYQFEDLKISAVTTGDSLKVLAGSERILNSNDEPLIEIPSIKTVASSNQVKFTISLADRDTFVNRGHLEGEMNFFSSNHFNLKIDSSYITLENRRWRLDQNDFIDFDSSHIAVPQISFSRELEYVGLKGGISKLPSEKLNVMFSGFDLLHMNTILKTGNGFLAGMLAGSVDISDVYHKPQLSGDLSISSFAINGDTIGNMAIHSLYNSEKEVLSSSVTAIKGTAKIIDITGDYYVNKDEDNIDYSVKLNNLYLHPVERYISDVMSNVHGKVSADVKMRGTFNHPEFSGIADLNKVSLTVNYLQTHYTFNTSVRVEKDRFIIRDMHLVDDNNKEAIVNGEISHSNFHHFIFDADMNAEKFQILHTDAKDNSLYYGVANATGYAKFSGPLTNMNMDISLSPDKGTVINIPLNTYSDLSKNEFITFINHNDSTGPDSRSTKVDLSGVRLSMNLDMNRNAEMKIIFDEKIGDVISGSGTGSLKLDINTAGNFNMYGTYTIEKGEYLFTLQNLINKRFMIDNGSRITWAGDPYEAIVDLSAVYTVYTSSLYNILADSSYKRRIPVDCRLFLTNKLMNPTINYEIATRGLDPTAEGIVKSYLNSEQEINRQMFGLLVFNQFLPQSGAGQAVGRVDAGAGAGASVSELLSNQVSNWLGQLSKEVNLGFNYRAKDTYSPTEFQILISKSLFNDKLVISGNVGYLSDQATTNVVGDFNAEYKIGDGRFRLKGFNRSNADNIINYSQSPYTQGFGVFYRQEFNTWDDLMRKWGLKATKKVDSEK